MLRHTVISALAPKISVSCQILVLGSMPGATSKKEAEYYAHIGLWDVLASCSRKASSDATIRDAKCNDFVKLLSAYPKIDRICLNGRTAFDYWRRLVIPSFADEIDKELLADVEIIGLPSTSPAHAALSPAAKINAWCAALSKR